MASSLSSAMRSEVARRVAGHNRWVRLTRWRRHANAASLMVAAAGMYSLGLPDLFLASLPWAMGSVWSNLVLADALDADPDARPLLPHADPTREIELLPNELDLGAKDAHDLCMAIVARRDRASL